MEWNENETVLAVFVPNICTLNTATSKPDFQNTFFLSDTFCNIPGIYLDNLSSFLKYTID